MRARESESEMKMGLYAKYVLPRLIDLAMRNKYTTRLRAEYLPQARGDVLEIGIGSGLNLRFYSPEVRHVYGVDPSVELQRMAAERASAVPFEVTFEVVTKLSSGDGTMTLRLSLTSSGVESEGSVDALIGRDEALLSVWLRQAHL